MAANGIKSEAEAAFQPFKLPNGSTLKNRIAKAAMEEKLADSYNFNRPSESLINLYRIWGEGGAGLILSGHIMIDPRAMAAPGDVVLAEDAGPFDEGLWRQLIGEAKKGGAQFWLQINHPGRQIRTGTGLPTYGPSAVPMQMGVLSKMFPVPIAMTEEQIQDMIRRFAWSAKKAEELGADGVEIHAAHGYQISAFLSPLTNKRTDQWGGSPENRSRLLFEVLKAIRAAVSPGFGVGIKLNTADFQRGGFAAPDLYAIVEKLNEYDLDILELSGGSYESPAMSGHYSQTSTSKREAYFLEAANAIEKVAKMPIMVTGGISQLQTLRTVISSSDKYIAGVGTAIGYMPDLPLRWARGEDPAPQPAKSWILKGKVYSASKIATVMYNLQSWGAGKKKPWNGVWPAIALGSDMMREPKQMKGYKSWITKVDAGQAKA